VGAVRLPPFPPETAATLDCKIEQRLEELFRSGLIVTTGAATATEPAMFRAHTVVERRGALLARSRPRPVAVRITEDTLGQFLDGVAAAICRHESALVRRSAEPRVRVALRAVFPSRVEVDPESPITRPAVWVPPGDPSGGPSSPGAPAQLGAGTPTPPPPSDPDDGVDLD